jgi:glycosyltransferase involved in cell wall biosynthesis
LVDDYGVDADKVHVIAPGSDVDLFDFPARQPNKTPRILFVGGDFVRKGGDLLLDVYRERLRGRAELHLVTGGDVAEEEGVHVYKGLTANSPALLDLFRTADLFALPTRADCLAMVLGEAMASSLPIVTTTVGGHPEAVKSGETGFLTEPDDEDGLAAALETLIDNPGLRVQMGRSSHELGLQKFDARRNAKTILDLMQEIA